MTETSFERYRRPENHKCSPVVSDERQMNATEKTLLMWYKCTSASCYATANDHMAFAAHLNARHAKQQLFCLYCNFFSDEVKTTYSADALVEHIRRDHRHRRFQCNLCTFRAISADHVNIHQSIIHDEYDADRNGDQACKILESALIDSQAVSAPKMKYFWPKRTEKLNVNERCDLFQCFYCTFMNTKKLIVFSHCAQRHCDYPILCYTTQQEISSTKTSPKHEKANAFNYSLEKDLMTEETQENAISSTGVHHMDLDSDMDSESTASYSSVANKRKNEQMIDTKRIKLDAIANATPDLNSNAIAVAKEINENDGNDEKREVKVELMKEADNWPTVSSFCAPLSNATQDKSAEENSESQMKYNCNICKGKAAKMSKSKIADHLRTYHGSESTLLCSHCNQFYGNDIESHCKLHNQTISDIFEYITPANVENVDHFNKNELNKELIIEESTPQSSQQNTEHSSVNVISSTDALPIDSDSDNSDNISVNSDDSSNASVLKNNCKEKSIKVVLTRLDPDLDFDDPQVVRKYLMDNNIIPKARNISTESESVASDACDSVVSVSDSDDDLNRHSRVGVHRKIYEDQHQDQHEDQHEDQSSSQSYQVCAEHQVEHNSHIMCEDGTASRSTPKVTTITITEEDKNKLRESLTNELPIGCLHCFAKFQTRIEYKAHCTAQHIGRSPLFIFKPKI